MSHIICIEIEIDGLVKNISFIYYVESIANSPTRDNLIKSDGKVSEASDQFTLPDSQYTDAIYYGEFDLDKVTKEKKQICEELLQQVTLIWDR
ncbi:hypothetical protein [Lysinibacillus sp. NPDC059133]|uniref:hypothetical protein n=1 Tax=Lysinibacillus sp. NPDC059133 TaxID=3346737 RepID=UPI0036870997